METVITKKGQVVIPAALRRKYRIEIGSRIQWIDTGMAIKLIPIPKDPISALRGHAKGEGLTQVLLDNRRKDAAVER